MLVREVWVEYTPTRWSCSGCLQLFDSPDALTEHQQYYLEQDIYTHAGSSTVSENRIAHPTEYKTRTVIDKEAYNEMVVIGYKCSICGATK